MTKTSKDCFVVDSVGQDCRALEWLQCSPKGFYLDFGANDGQWGSNTAILDQFGWQGICVDPFPQNFANRTCNVVRRPLFSSDGKSVNFTLSAIYGFSGLTNTLGRWRETAERDSVVVPMLTMSASTLLHQLHAPPCIDYMSLDTEGAELDILSAFPFDSHCIRYLNVEHNYEEPKRSQIRSLLLANGYSLDTHSDHLIIDDNYLNPCVNFCRA